MSSPDEIKSRLMKMAREVDGLTWADRFCIGQAIGLIDAGIATPPAAPAATEAPSVPGLQTLRRILDAFREDGRFDADGEETRDIANLLDTLAAPTTAAAVGTSPDTLPRYILWDSKHPDYPVEWTNPGRPTRDGEIGFFRHDIVYELMEEQRASLAAVGASVQPVPEGLKDERLTVAAISMATMTRMQPLMRAIKDAGEGEVTANQKLTMDQALQALTALATTSSAAPDPRDAEIARLNAIINTPQADDFLRAVSTEAEHQRQRWGSDHDAGKTPADWFWLVGYLAGKALHAHAAGNTEKAEHHIITTGAACANWHLGLFGKTNMRPGHEEGIDGAAQPESGVKP